MTEHHRFIERDYLFASTKASTHYITDEAINSILDEHGYFDDLTFELETTQTGFKTKVYDNNTEEYITLNSISGLAFDYYLQLVKELSIKKTQEEIATENIHKIKSIFSEWANNRTDKKRYNSNTNHKQRIAQ